MTSKAIGLTLAYIALWAANPNSLILHVYLAIHFTIHLILSHFRAQTP
jgi:hypothetical protein